jgi:RND family efflux transporter MFP subunit
LLLGFGGKDGDTTSINNSLLQKLKSQSGYTLAELNLKSALMDFENTYIKAPFDGMVAGIEKQAFNQIAISDKFCSLLSFNSFDAHFSIIEKELPKLHIGQRIKISPLANDSISYWGKISEINPLVDKNGLIKVIAKVGNPDTNIKEDFNLISGMNVKITIENILVSQLSIPKSALVLRSGKEVVFSYEEGRAKWNYVKTNAENKCCYAVLEGLKENDTIIVEGALNLAHDAIVELTSQR